MQPAPGQNPLAQLGLPAGWAPVPIGWTFATVDTMGPNGRESLRVVLIDTPTGRLGLAFPADSLRAFADQAHEQCSGIQVARLGGTVPANGNGRPA